MDSVLTARSGFSGDSYGADIPVKSLISPDLAFFTVFEQEVRTDGIKLSRYYHQYGASLDDIMFSTTVADSQKEIESKNENLYDFSQINDEDRSTILETLKEAMINSAESLEFEKAARIRDEIAEIEAGMK